MKRLFYIIIVTIITGMVSCVEPPIGQTSVDSLPPSPVLNVEISPTAGGAVITYELPANDNDISYVKCEYTYNGEKYVVRSSVYTNSLVIEGLGADDPIDVTLYVVDHSENVSTGVTKNFKPAPPLWQAIYESLEIQPSFGGVAITWTNESQTEIGITVYTEDSTGVMREGETRYTKDPDGEIPFYGYDFVETKFAARIIDKWGNISPVKEATVVPLYESELDKSKWKALVLPGDNNSVSNNRPLSNCWNGNTAYASIWHTAEGQFMPFPMYFTIDLGEVVKFSRMRLLARNRADYYYSSHTFREFEVWGATQYREGMPEDYWRYGDVWKTDGDWEKLGDFEVKRPSGDPNPTGNPTGEDLAYAQAGFPFSVSYRKKPLQYLRFVIKRTWGSGGLHMCEFWFYGDNGSILNPDTE
jgi:hypothetical protein